MIEEFGNLWSIHPNAHARVITTNGTIKSSDGRAVMGKGCAGEAARQFPGLPWRLAKRIQEKGNHVLEFKNLSPPADFVLVTFPTKHEWHQNSDLNLIFRSACELADLADRKDYGITICPRFGAGAGNLAWKDVKRVIQGVLDDRFIIVTHPE